MDFESKLLEIMDKSGIHIDGDINWFSNDFQRFKVKNHWKRGKPLFVVLHQGGASFGDWRDPSTWVTWWYKSWNEITKEERLARINQIERLSNERRLLQAHAIWRANMMLEHRTYKGPTCVEASLEHPYIIKKRINPYYAYQIRSYLIIPIFDINGSLQSLQYIKSNGDKRFKKNASPKDGYCLLGEIIKKDIDILWICEGWATGCAIYEAVGENVICALSASNLESVVYQFRLKYPNNRIVVCADNDSHLKTNVGVISAKKAADNGAAILRVPNMQGDWNDLMCIKGIEEVEKQLLNF